MLPGHASTGVLLCPFVVELIDDEDAIFVAKFNKLATVGVVRGANVVDAKLLHQENALFDGAGIVGGTEGTQGVVVGISLQEHFPAVELHAEGGTELHRADAEMLGNAVGDGAVGPDERHLGGVEIGCFGVPQLRMLNLGSFEVCVLGASLRMAAHRGGLFVNQLSVRGIDFQLKGGLRVFVSVGKGGRNVDEAVVAGGDVERMAFQVKVFGRAHDFHPSEQSSAGVPSRVQGVAGVGQDSYDVVLSLFQKLCDVGLKSHISVVCASCRLSVDEHVADVHDAGEVYEHALVAKLLAGGEMVAVPGFPHFLEAPARQAALDIGGHVGVVGTLRGVGFHPRLFNLEIMGEVYYAPLAVVEVGVLCAVHLSGLEFPTEVDVFHHPFLCLRISGDEDDKE